MIDQMALLPFRVVPCLNEPSIVWRVGWGKVYAKRQTSFHLADVRYDLAGRAILHSQTGNQFRMQLDLTRHALGLWPGADKDAPDYEVWRGFENRLESVAGSLYGFGDLFINPSHGESAAELRIELWLKEFAGHEFAWHCAFCALQGLTVCAVTYLLDQ